MTYTVAITSQGQISIPAKIRRQLGLNKTMRAVVSSQGGKVIIEPVKDILELAGSFKTKAKASPKQIRRGFEDYLAQEAVGKN
jgi:AbrB family looped-hinge helix DNA binding protein